MRTIKIICWVCKELVEVRDKIIAEHNDCPVSGMRYIPSPRITKSGPGGPSFEIVAARPLEETGISCPRCGDDHGGIELLGRINVPDPTVN